MAMILHFDRWSWNEIHSRIDKKYILQGSISRPTVPHSTQVRNVFSRRALEWKPSRVSAPVIALTIVWSLMIILVPHSWWLPHTDCNSFSKADCDVSNVCSFSPTTSKCTPSKILFLACADYPANHLHLVVACDTLSKYELSCSARSCCVETSTYACSIGLNHSTYELHASLLITFH